MKKSMIKRISCVRQLGFTTEYDCDEICCSLVLYGMRDIIFYSRSVKDASGLYAIDQPADRKIELSKELEPLDYYHSQFGLALSEKQGCFFIGYWGHPWERNCGVYCCDLNDGHIRWNYRLKHATYVHIYDDYIVCLFQEIGLRKLSYDGKEIAKYPYANSVLCAPIETASLLIGPKHGSYFILDTVSMTEIRKIPRKLISTMDNLIILDGSGDQDRIVFRGYEFMEDQLTEPDQPDQPFEREVKPLLIT